MRKDRLIVGILCIAFAVWTFLANTTIGPAIGIGILGLIIVAISRNRIRKTLDMATIPAVIILPAKSGIT